MKSKRRCIQSYLAFKNLTGTILFILIIDSCNTSHENFIYPEKEYPVLFNDVQINKVFSDDKTFPDCIPKSSSSIINFKYWVWKKRHSVGELKDFVNVNFEIPALYVDSTHLKYDILDHLKDVSAALLIKTDKQPDHSSLIPLPNDFIIPGGRFRETYYWDTYFTLLGYSRLGEKNVIFEVTENMAFLINKFGHIPNGNRSYYLSRSQPPFFSLIVEMTANLYSDTMYVHFLPEMVKEYQFWMNNPKMASVFEHCVILKDSVILNRYFDLLDIPRIEMYSEDLNNFKKHKGLISDTNNYYRNIRSTAESGWDFSTRWLISDTDNWSISTLSILPVDLNCLLYHLEKSICKGYQLKGDNKSFDYARLAKIRKENIEQVFWNDSAGYYFDYNFNKNHQMMKYTLAGVYPLFTGIADSSEAIKVRDNIRKYFLKSGGVVTTLTNSGLQWDYPNGWAPLEWITIQSLNKYHFSGLADTIKMRWIHVNEACFNSTHKMLEKYNVVDTAYAPRNGEYPTQDGFGWTNGVFLDIVKAQN